ncbi:MAG: hypothetical protein U1E10_14485 [Bdellovibrionales bacterium]|nr:hypothetical protein [Bdellovibrionales bacterium]
MFFHVLAILIFGTLVTLETRAEPAEGGGAIALMKIKDRDALVREAAKFQTGAVIGRACAFQRKQNLPPVSCFVFAQSGIETQALTEDCIRLSPKALVLPAVDSSVSELCRQAIETRRLDLKYATRERGTNPPRTPDASR